MPCVPKRHNSTLFDKFRHTMSENAVKGRVEIFARKYYPTLTEWSDTLPSQRERQHDFPSCHTASVGCGATPHK